jgi:hypothetical protein
MEYLNKKNYKLTILALKQPVIVSVCSVQDFVQNFLSLLYMGFAILKLIEIIYNFQQYLNKICGIFCFVSKPYITQIDIYSQKMTKYVLFQITRRK